jgi:hypothetical protein
VLKAEYIFIWKPLSLCVEIGAAMLRVCVRVRRTVHTCSGRTVTSLWCDGQIPTSLRTSPEQNIVTRFVTMFCSGCRPHCSVTMFCSVFCYKCGRALTLLASAKGAQVSLPFMPQLWRTEACHIHIRRYNHKKLRTSSVQHVIRCQRRLSQNWMLCPLSKEHRPHTCMFLAFSALSSCQYCFC